MSQRVHDTTAKAADLTPPEAAQVRTSRKRAEGLKQYIEGLLPSHLAAEVDVVITEKVSTAAVLPATEDALLDGDETEFTRQQAKQLVERVDGDYLVLVTGREADTDSICLSDQLTADTAHQFGLAFHETLHILKTSFGAVQTLVEEEVEDQYQDFVHELINIGEDGAIENEAQTGDDFTERAGNRLTLVRQMHSQTVEDLPDEKREFSFGDALLKGLHDEIIYPTGVTEALLDDSDSRVTFRTDDEREAFLEVHEEIVALRDDLLALRSDHSDRLYQDDREASLQRAKRIITFWHDVLKPIIENGQPPQQQGQQNQQQSEQTQQSQQGQSQNQPQQGESSSSNQQQTHGEEVADSTGGEHSESGNESESSDGDFDCPDCDDSFDTDHGRRTHYGQEHGDTDELDEQLDDSETAEGGDSEQSDSASDAGAESPDGDIDPEELSLDTGSYENPLQDVDSHPSIGDEPDPDDVDLEPQPIAESPDTSNDSTTGEQDDGNDGNVGGSPNSEPTSGDNTGDGSSEDGAGEETGTEPSDGDGQDDAAGGGGTDSRADDSSGEDASNSSSPTNGGSSGVGEQTGPEEGSSASKGGDSEPESEAGDERAEPEMATTSSSAASSDLASHTEQNSSSGDDQQATFGDFANNSSGEQTTGNSDAERSGADDVEDEHGSDEEAGEAADGDGSSGPGDEADNGHEPTADDAGGPDDPEQGSKDNDVDFDPASSTDSQEPAEQAGSSASADNRSSSTVGDTDNSSDGVSEGPESQFECNEPGNQSASPRDEQYGGDEAGDDEAAETATGPAHAETNLDPEDFAGDRQRANRTANESTINEQDLADDLQSLESALGDEKETAPGGDGGGGDGAGPGSIDELTILPEPEDGEQSEDWQDVEKAADTVADTLAKELRLDQQTESRNGLSAGTQVNTKTAYRLNHNDPRTFSETLPGDEKEYFIVFVLDRSSSMGPGYYANRSSGPAKIDVATSAVARFAVACEDLDIDVAIIDFYDDEARYVKPPSVETEFAQDSIRNSDNAGGTPLSDALSLARTIADADAKESLIITITDDKPAEVEDVEQQIKSSYSPVCSLTIATDCEFGNPPEKAERLEKTYDQTTTVYEPSKLDDRIDELASLLGAY